MKNFKIFSLALIISISLGVTVNSVNSQTPTAANTSVTATRGIQCPMVNPLDVVNNPHKYLNKSIKIKGKFDKFSTLGLDYPPAMKSSEEYISFLIQRPDVQNHNIPLSELKIFLKKDIAEKNIDLDAGDEVEFTGRIFSVALGDPWMEVTNFTVLTHKEKKAESNKH